MRGVWLAALKTDRTSGMLKDVRSDFFCGQAWLDNKNRRPAIRKKGWPAVLTDIFIRLILRKQGFILNRLPLFDSLTALADNAAPPDGKEFVAAFLNSRRISRNKALTGRYRRVFGFKQLKIVYKRKKTAGRRSFLSKSNLSANRLTNCRPLIIMYVQILYCGAAATSVLRRRRRNI